MRQIILDLLLAVLRHTGATVTTTERDQLRDVLAGWRLPAGQVDEPATRR